MFPFNNHSIITKLFIILYHSYCCYLNTLYNLFAHYPCTFLLILLFIKSTQSILLHILFYILLIFFLLSYFLLNFSYLYLCIFSCVCIPCNCSVQGADLTYISLLVIFCIIVYVTNKILSLELTISESNSSPKNANLLKKNYPQTVQDVDEFVLSFEQIWRNVSLHHLLINGSSAVNGCRQNESPNS